MSTSEQGPGDPSNPIESRIEVLLHALGIDEDSYLSFVEWALSEHLVAEMRREVDGEFFRRKDALKAFRALLESRTRRRWSPHDYERLAARVEDSFKKHYRQPIKYEELAILRDEEELECAKCGARPPDVLLHIDHMFPASKGGSSKRENLQFLCSTHNLQKSDKVEAREPWLDLS